MSAADTAADARLLTFEVGGTVFALPISGVLEVTEIEALTCIPTIPTDVGGVMNYHGDALPVIRTESLLDVDPAERVPATHVLVITDRHGDAARLGVPVDRVLGLVDGAGATALGSDPVAERRSIHGRVASVLDPKRLVGRALAAIERAPERSV